VAVDDEAGPLVDQDLLDPADRVERAGQGVLLRLRVDSPVGGVGQELVGCLLAGPGDPVAPARRAPVAVLAAPSAEDAGAEPLPGSRALEGVVTAAAGLLGVL
jgi:hypothetical protein